MFGKKPEDIGGRGDLRFWRLQDRIPTEGIPGEEGLAEVTPLEAVAGRYEPLAVFHLDVEHLTLRD